MVKLSFVILICNWKYLGNLQSDFIWNFIPCFNPSASFEPLRMYTVESYGWCYMFICMEQACTESCRSFLMWQREERNWLMLRFFFKKKDGGVWLDGACILGQKPKIESQNWARFELWEIFLLSDPTKLSAVCVYIRRTDDYLRLKFSMIFCFFFLWPHNR
jgi:hypothetical protein